VKWRYERMMVDGEFTWPKPFWEQLLWRWDSMFDVFVDTSSRSCSRRGSCSGYAVLRGEKAPDDALARELGAMGLL